MLTIFTIPKGFCNHFAVIQRNAIQSWLRLEPACEVILFGNDPGTAEVAAELGIRHVPDVECNEYGTPLLSSAFEKAQQIASHSLVCYLNADIILMSDFTQAVQRIRMRPFMMVGRRWCLDLGQPVNFDDAEWERELRSAAAEQGVLDDMAAVDYYVFPRGLVKEMPPFAVGRAGWDNGFIYWARSHGVPLIDATEAVMAIHQNHDYSHHPDGKEGAYKGPEAKQNIVLAGGLEHVRFTLWDATWLLGPQGLRPALKEVYLRRYRQSLPILFPQGGVRVEVLRAMISLGLMLYWWLPRLRPHRLTSALVRRVRAFHSAHFSHRDGQTIGVDGPDPDDISARKNQR